MNNLSISRYETTEKTHQDNKRKLLQIVKAKCHQFKPVDNADVHEAASKIFSGLEHLRVRNIGKITKNVKARIDGHTYDFHF